MTDSRAFTALVMFWLRQLLPICRRLVLAVLGFGLILHVTGKADLELLSALLVGSSLAYTIPPSLFMFQSKAAGDLEMITELPVPASMISLSIAAATTVVVMPGAVSAALGAAIGFQVIGFDSPSFILLFACCWLLLWLASWSLAALGTAFTPEAFINGPVAVVGLLLLLGGLLPDPQPENVIAWLTTPRGTSIAATLGTVVFLSGAFVLHRLTCYGIVRYEAVPESERWSSRIVRRKRTVRSAE